MTSLLMAPLYPHTLKSTPSAACSLASVAIFDTITTFNLSVLYFDSV